MGIRHGHIYLEEAKKTNLYKTIFCIFVIIGAAASLQAAVDFADAMVFSMMVPNMIGLYLLTPKVKEELKRYRKAIRLKKDKKLIKKMHLF